MSDIANLGELVRIIIPCRLDLIDEPGLGDRAERAGQERQQIFGNLLAPTGERAGQTRPGDACYWVQGGVPNGGSRTHWPTLNRALVSGFRGGQPVFPAKPEGMLASRPTDRVRVDPPRTDLAAAVEDSVGDAVVCQAQSPGVDLRINRSPVDLEKF